MQFQRCIPTLLLFNMILQSCHNPDLKLECDEAPKAPESQQRDNLVPSLQLLPIASAKPPLSSNHAVSTAKISDNLRERAHATPIAPSISIAASHAQHVDNAIDVFTSLETAPMPRAMAKPSVNHTALEASSRAASGMPITPPYLIAQGNQVRFQEQEGMWQAQVQDVWRRVEVLPVLFAPHQVPEGAIASLASKALGQHKYSIHIIEANRRLPWSTRAVYVGAAAVRGGGDNSSHDHDDAIRRIRSLAATPRVGSLESRFSSTLGTDTSLRDAERSAFIRYGFRPGSGLSASSVLRLASTPTSLESNPSLGTSSFLRSDLGTPTSFRSSSGTSAGPFGEVIDATRRGRDREEDLSRELSKQEQAYLRGKEQEELRHCAIFVLLTSWLFGHGGPLWFIQNTTTYNDSK